NVGMVNASVSGKDDCGGLAGRIVFSSVTNCYSTGSVTGVSYIGGLVGDSYSGTITNCYSTATVSGTTYSGGGLVGQNNTDAIIRNSYATGNVSGFTQGAGGLVGNNHTRSTISNSYSTGNVSGRYAGGFAGINSSNSSITNCYSTGSVTSNSNYGGFIGFMNTSTEPGCFWDTETSLQITTLGEAVGKSTSEMKNYVTYFSAQWDFKGETAFGTDDLWNIGNSRNNGYPYLNWQFPGDPGPQTPDPDAQPTNLTFSTSGSGPSSIIVKYSASETAQNYLVVRKAGSAPSFVPSNGTSYTTGTQGGDYIVYAGSGTTATDNNLSLGSSYYYAVFAYNGSGSATKYLTSNPLSGNIHLNSGNSQTVSGSGSVSAGFPGVGVTVTFPGGTAGTTIDASKTNSVPASNFAALPGVRGMKNLYFTITSSNATPGTYTLVLDFSSLPDMTEAKWNKFKIMKRADNSAPWIDVTAAPHNATIVSRNTDGIWGKFTVSGLTSFSEFGGGEESVTHTVTSNSNDITVDGSLRKLINTADAGDVITFNTATWGGSRTITVADSAIYIYKDLTIRGIDGGIILDGNNASKVLLVGSSVEDPLEPVVRLEKLIITRGNDPADRVGGIDNYGDLTMVNCVVADNRDLGVSAGTGAVGGILSNGEVTLINCTVAGNTGAATDGGIGGIYA
ncbi:hypothetical protein ANRL1_00934, partial [Anaerolineae bacterium]